MVSAKAYIELVEKFYAKYETILSKSMKKSVTDVLGWGLGYSKVMNAGKDYESTQAKITYLKRGANLMAKFIEIYERDSADMKEKLRQCRQALLGTKQKDMEWCTPETKDKLLKFALNLDIFTSEFIGCADSANDFLLSLMKKNAKILGDEYDKILRKMEYMCMHITLEKLR